MGDDGDDDMERYPPQVQGLLLLDEDLGTISKASGTVRNNL